MPIVAWYMLSNESYIKRVMSEVLPTVGKMVSISVHGSRNRSSCRIPLCSPRKTSLYSGQYDGVCQMDCEREGRGCTNLNFFKGLLYDPPAPDCAMLGYDE